MRYYGEIYDKKGHIVGVEIVTDKDKSTTVTIGDDASGMWFAAEEAVTIEGQTNDLFDVLLRQSATIRLEVREFVPDFFKADFRDATVRITLDGVAVFRGYVMPRTYSQGYTMAVETLELNCVDRLTALQWVKWRGIGEDGVTYDVMKRYATELSVAQILMVIFSQVGFRTINIGNSDIKVSSGTGADVYWENTRYNEQVFFGATEEDVWTCEEVLTQILQYFNLHAVDTGTDVDFFTWESRKFCEVVNIDSKMSADVDTQISIPEIYSRVSVRCEGEANEIVVPDIFTDDSCTSPYHSTQLYCSEYSMESSDEKNFKWGHLEDSDAFGAMCAGEDPSGIFSNLIWRRDYWIRAMQSKGWQMRADQRVDVGGTPVLWDGTLPVGNHTPIYMDSVLKSGRDMDKVASYITQQGGSALLNVTTGKRTFKEADRGDMGSTSTDKYLVIGVPGDGSQYDRERRNVPKAVYSGDDVTLSPADDATTHYLDISGMITLAPATPTTPLMSEARTVYKNGTRQQLHDYMVNNLRVPYTNDKERILTRMWYTAESPSPLRGNVIESRWLQGGKNYCGLDMPCSEEMRKSWVFPGRSNTFMLDSLVPLVFKIDALPVPVLRCMLIVGNKCVVERKVQTGDGVMREFKWEVYDPAKVAAGDFSQSFCLSMDVKAGSYVVGEEHSIARNIDYTKMLDFKGTAIPIRKSDNVKGKVTFLILGRSDLIGFRYNDLLKWTLGAGDSALATLKAAGKTVDNTPDAIPAYTDIRQYLKTDTTHRTHERIYPIFKDVTAIWIKDFNISLLTDNAYKDPLQEKDIVCIAEDSSGFINFREETVFKVFSALTDAERSQLGVRDQAGMAFTMTPDGKPVTEIVEGYYNTRGKPERMYSEWYLKEYSTPRLEVEQSIFTTDADPAKYRYTLPAFPGVKFYPVSVNRDLQAGTARIKMREIKR